MVLRLLWHVSYHHPNKPHRCYYRLVSRDSWWQLELLRSELPLCISPQRQLERLRLLYWLSGGLRSIVHWFWAKRKIKKMFAPAGSRWRTFLGKPSGIAERQCVPIQKQKIQSDLNALNLDSGRFYCIKYLPQTQIQWRGICFCDEKGLFLPQILQR